jgi:hypothetical protein
MTLLQKRWQPLVLGSITTLASLSTSLSAEALTFNNGGGTITAGGLPPTTTPVNFSFSVSNATAVQITEVSLTFSFLSATGLNNGIGQTGLGALELYLQNSGGTRILPLKALIANNGDITYTGVTLTDTASNTIDSATAVAGDITGSYQAQGGSNLFLTTNNISNFAGFDGLFIESSPQTWNLTAYNTDGSTNATLGAVTLTIDTAPVPFEVDGTLGLLVLGGIYRGYRWIKRR